MLRNITFHPLVFAIYPPLILLANNLNEVPARDAGRSIVISFVLSLVIWGALSLVLKDGIKAGLLTTWLLVLFFSYGHIYWTTKLWSIGEFLVGRHRFLVPLWLVLLGFGGWWVLKKLVDHQGLTNFLNVLASVAILFPLFSVVSFGARSLKSEIAPSAGTQVSSISSPYSDNLPDIYYIILDGYSRADILSEIFNYDNGEFIAFLEGNGFYVAKDAHSNYARTIFSLASSLNMDYMNELERMYPQGDSFYDGTKKILRASAVRTIIEDLGYVFVSFETGYYITEMKNADKYLKGEDLDHEFTISKRFSITGSALYFNNFEGLFVESTFLRSLMEAGIIFKVDGFTVDRAYQKDRNRIIFTSAHLADFADKEGDYFVFAHFLAPHPPFVFGPNGERVDNPRTYKINDATAFEGTKREYVQGYRNEVIYINSLLKATISNILAKSDEPPIIIIQGDHGSGVDVDYDSIENSNLNERLSILNAYYFPNGNYGSLYPSITPVNSFRVVLNQFFDTDFDLLLDESYFAKGWFNNDFVNVTDLLR